MEGKVEYTVKKFNCLNTPLEFQNHRPVEGNWASKPKLREGDLLKSHS